MRDAAGNCSQFCGLHLTYLNKTLQRNVAPLSVVVNSFRFLFPVEVD